MPNKTLPPVAYNADAAFFDPFADFSGGLGRANQWSIDQVNKLPDPNKKPSLFSLFGLGDFEDRYRKDDELGQHIQTMQGGKYTDDQRARLDSFGIDTRPSEQEFVDAAKGAQQVLGQRYYDQQVGSRFPLGGRLGQRTLLGRQMFSPVEQLVIGGRYLQSQMFDDEEDRLARAAYDRAFGSQTRSSPFRLRR